MTSANQNTDMVNFRDVSLGGLCLALAALVLWLDRHTELWLAHGLVYLPIIIVASWVRIQYFQEVVLVLAIGFVFSGVISVPAPFADALPIHSLSYRLLAVISLLILHWGLIKRQTLQRTTQEFEEKDRERQTYFEAITDHFPVQLWSADADGHVDHVGEELITLTGKSREEILADWPALIHADDRQRTLDTWMQSVSTGSPYRVDFRIRRSDGIYLWHKTQARPEFDNDGRVMRWFGTSYDIDDLLRLRGEANQLAEKFKRTVESITDAFITLDRDLRVTYANQKAADVSGMSMDKILGQPIQGLKARGLRDRFFRELETAMQAQKDVRFEEFYPQGERWLDVRVYPSRHGLTVYFLDVTEQKREKEQLLLLNSAVARLNDIVIITEADPIDEPGPRIVFVNDAFERITGYSKEQAIGQSPRLLQGPGTQRHELDRIRHAMETRKAVRARLLNYTKAGIEYWVEIDVVPITDENGACTHFVAVQRDITEQKRLQDQLAVAHRMESIGQLTGGVAHDFNNLLSVVMGSAEVLSDELTKSKHPDLVELSDLICQAAERGAALTKNMLAFARRQPLQPTRVDLHQLLADLMPILKTSAGEINTLTLEIDPEVWAVAIDAGQLENSLLNMVINARDAMPKGGTIAIRVKNGHMDEELAETIPGMSAGQYVQICLSDSGAGMTAEQQQKAFEPFFTTKEELGGSGLGLSMVYGFIKQSRGHITVYSELGEGTTFRLYLPPAIEGDRPAAERHVLEATPEQQRSDGAILIVEDNPEIRELAASTLRSAGYSIDTVENADEALKKLEEGVAVDLVFSDVVMPGEMSGLDLAEHLKAWYPKVEIVLASGFANLDSERADGSHSRFPILQKPYRRKDLLREIEARFQQLK